MFKETLTLTSNRFFLLITFNRIVIGIGKYIHITIETTTIEQQLQQAINYLINCEHY